MADILRVLRARGGWWVKVHGGPYQRKGIPDIIGCYKGRFVGIEVKTRAGELSALQAMTLANIEGCGGLATVIRYGPEEALVWLLTKTS